MTFTDEQMTANYEALFDPLTRAAQMACLTHARSARDIPRPTVKDCLTFARLYGVDGAALAAFFGHLGWSERGQTIWVDAVDGKVSPQLVQKRITDAQALAFGFLVAVTGEVATGPEN